MPSWRCATAGTRDPASGLIVRQGWAFAPWMLSLRAPETDRWAATAEEPLRRMLLLGAAGRLSGGGMRSRLVTIR